MNILAIFPHPDDAAFDAGGTLARWVSEGHSVATVCVTPGSVGTLRLDQTQAQLGAARTAELRAANEKLGIQSLKVLDYPDGGVMDLASLRRELFHIVRQYRPQRIMAMDPWAPYEVHPDHINVGRMAAEAAAFACFPLLYPEQITEDVGAHQVEELWLMGLLGKKPNMFVNIEEHLETKVDALMEFESTMNTIYAMLGIDPLSDVSEMRLQTREWTKRLSERCGRVVGLNYAEAFVVEKLAPGHFCNIDQQFAEMFGESPPPPQVYR